MRLPKVLVGLGTVSQIEILTPDENLMQFSFLVKQGYQLCANSTGTALFIFPGRDEIKGVEGEPSMVWPQIDRAQKLYEKWSDFEVDAVNAYKVSGKPLRTVGSGYSITYRSDKWTGKITPYIHHFTSPVKIKMDDIDNPRLIQIFGGKLKVQPRGIVG